MYTDGGDYPYDHLSCHLFLHPIMPGFMGGGRDFLGW